MPGTLMFWLVQQHGKLETREVNVLAELTQSTTDGFGCLEAYLGFQVASRPLYMFSTFKYLIHLIQTKIA